MGAIPTRYEGVEFRSRLEAKWAAFFDLAGWRWEYEPVDLNGYIPDFFLMFYKPLLVEVKPATTSEELEAHSQKIKDSGWKGEVLILGATLLRGESAWSEDYLGIISEAFGHISEDTGEDCTWFTEAGFSDCPNCEYGLRHPSGGWSCYKCGKWSKFCFHSDIVTLWRQAGNMVQWKGRKQTRT